MELRLKIQRVSLNSPSNTCTVALQSEYTLIVIVSSAIRLSLSGIDYANNSAITITDIGTDYLLPLTEGLQCITDHRPCCRHYVRSQGIYQGEWYYPNGSHILANNEHSNDFYRTRGHENGTVNLYRRNSGTKGPIGLFCCEIPDGSNVNQTLCVDIILGKQLLKDANKHLLK